MTGIRRRKSCPALKVLEQEKQWIWQLRQTRKLGARRLQNERSALVWVVFVPSVSFPSRSAANSLNLREQVIEELPFPIQRIQSDRAEEFFADAFQERLREYGIKFRPLKPRSPHLNGKVERSRAD